MRLETNSMTYGIDFLSQKKKERLEEVFEIEMK